MKTQQELLLHYWGPHYDMVKEYNAKHGCDVKPWACVKLVNDPMEQHPAFDFPVDSYTLALTILYDDKRKEHRPVFVGDKVYTYEEYRHFIVSEGSTHNNLIVKRCPEGNLTNLHLSHASWNPPTPNRMFKIGDTELPCPERENEGYQLSMWNRNYYFKTAEDRELVKSELLKLLTAARDKE